MRKSTDYNFVDSSQLSILGWWQHLFFNFLLWTFSNLSVQYHEHWIPTIQMQKLLIFCHICLQHFNTIFQHRWLVKSSTHCWDPHCTFPVIGTSSHPNILKCPVTTAFFSYTELKSAFLEFLPIYSSFALWKDVVKIVSFFSCLAALKTLIGDHLR